MCNSAPENINSSVHSPTRIPVYQQLDSEAICDAFFYYTATSGVPGNDYNRRLKH